MRKYLFVLFFLVVFVSYLAASDITINEVYYTVKGNGNSNQWIELYNNSSKQIDIGGWKISTSKSPDDGFIIPAGTTIGPKGFLVFAASKDVMSTLWGVKNSVVEYGDALGFSQEGEDIHLYNQSNTEIDAVWYGNGGDMGSNKAAKAVSFGMSIARSPDGNDSNNPSLDFSERFPTPAQSNSFTGFSQSTWGKIKAIYSIKKRLFFGV
ncbi:MAG: hypothetical protein B5M53_00585 [Candidatus Cloacimonas sp. 4484_209]|nr:MAG: hypothetical protein B5M53_00585 [Candidatus Cloacimonas sp. 4484_209]